MKRLSLVDRFWSHVDKNGPVHPVLLTPCWLWTMPPRACGYAYIKVNGKTCRVHRVAWKEIAGLDIPEGYGVLHHCDVKLCVNYETHLFTGTNADNNADMMTKDRHCHGDRVPWAKLSTIEVLEIRRLVAAGSRHRDVAALFSISHATVGRIHRREKWALLS